MTSYGRLERKLRLIRERYHFVFLEFYISNQKCEYLIEEVKDFEAMYDRWLRTCELTYHDSKSRRAQNYARLSNQYLTYEQLLEVQYGYYFYNRVTTEENDGEYDE